MGMGHDALSHVALKEGIDPFKLPDGQILMFLNRKRDKLKILGKQGIVVGYLKMPQGEKIAPHAIQYIPQCFGSSGAIDYSAALKKALLTKLGPNGSGSPAPKTARTPQPAKRTAQALTARTAN
jgi:hypothetical protein